MKIIFTNISTVIAAGILLVSLPLACTKKTDVAAQSDQHAQHNPQNGKQAPAKKDLYRCSMHPAITSDKPGTCPICQMNLEKVEDEGEHAHASPVATDTPLTGRAGFSLSQERQQMIGVTTTKVTIRQLSYEVRASGRVAFDPELYTAIEEYRQALWSHSEMTDKILKDQSSSLISSARTKLRLLGLNDDQIRSLSSGKTDPMNLLLPKGSMWIYAEVFEYEVSGLKPGLNIEVEAPSIPGKVLIGKVSSINPVVNSPTRTVRVRASVPDPQGLFRPDTFVNVRIKIELGEKLAVPEDSVLFSGEQKFVFIVKDKGRFDPRPIQTGLKAGSYYEVLSGLSEGDAVVTSANFLIDSESKLRGVLESADKPSAPAGGHAGHGGMK
ncbi:MAG: efflux RND transporter periplasmic adaptor subunit [Bdellovibrionota bacterium]